MVELDEMTEVLVTDAGVLVVTLNRSENRNALSDNILEDLGQICAHMLARMDHANCSAPEYA
jgi:enoyl-CoA hydratase/carnithine racemase